MLTSTPKKATSSEASLIQCLIPAKSLANNQRIAAFGRSQWDLRDTISKSFGRHAIQRIAILMFVKRNVFHS